MANLFRLEDAKDLKNASSSRAQLYNQLNLEQKIALIEEYCGACKQIKMRKGKPICMAFVEFYFLWRDDRCPAQLLDRGAEARECFAEDQHRTLLKPGRGEKSDRTHKLFGKQRMKDNRYKFPWDGFFI